jgi:DNA end-binding protein Ku
MVPSPPLAQWYPPPERVNGSWMPRSIWNGVIRFGLIAVPIKVHSATEDHGVHFHQVHAEDGARIRQKRICSKEGKEVPYEEVAKGYEVGDGEYVLLSQDEIDAAAGARSRTVELEQFVPAAEIDPVHYDRTYYVGAGKDGADAYRLLHDALERSGRAGIGRWVFHNREYLVSVRAIDSVLALHTMRFADELVAAEKLDVPKPSRAPTKREVDMAARLVDSMQQRFRPEKFEDSYRERVLELVKRKAAGEEVELPEPEPAEETPDLMAALEASLGGGRGSKGSTGSKGSKGSKSGGGRRGRSQSRRGQAARRSQSKRKARR